MANSYTEVTLSAAQQNGFTTPAYLKQEHLKVYVNNILVDGNTSVFGSFTSNANLTYSFTSATSTSINFSELILANNTVRVDRNSSQNARLNDYSDASLLTAEVMDQDANQMFFVAQEALDQAARSNLAAGSFYFSQGTAPENPELGTLWFNTESSPNTLQIWCGATEGWRYAAPTHNTYRYSKTSGVSYADTGQPNYGADSVYAGLSYIYNTSFTSSSAFYLNGVKQVGGTLTEINAVPPTADYVFQKSASKIWFRPIAQDDIIVVEAFSGSFSQEVSAKEASAQLAKEAAEAAQAAAEAAVNTVTGAVNNTVKLTGDQTIAGQKTFSDSISVGTINTDALELVNLDNEATATPVLSLYKNSISPTADDVLGAIRFFGNNPNASNKKFMGGIECTYKGGITTGNSANEETAKLSFYLPRGDGYIDSIASDNPVTSITGDITGDHVFMELDEQYLTVNTENGFKFNPASSDGVFITTPVQNGTGLITINNNDTTSASSISLPNTSGTLIVGERDSNGNLRLTESYLRDIELAPRTEVISAAHNPTNSNSLLLVKNRKYVNTNSASVNTFVLPTGTATGQMITVVNASDKALLIDRDTNSLTVKKLVAGSDPLTLSSASLSIEKGGVVEFVYSSNTEVQCFGSGI